MIVKNIKFSKGKKICELEFDNGEIIFCSLDLILKFQISKNEFIDSNKLSLLKKEQRLLDAKKASLNYVSYKQRTEKQVMDKLALIGYNPDEIQSCLFFLKDFGYLDDESFAEKYIKDNIKRKTPSKKKLIFDLMKKGISREIIDKYMNLLFKEDDDLDNAKKKLKKVGYKLKSMNETEKKKYIYSFLSRQGFNGETIKKAISEYFFSS